MKLQIKDKAVRKFFIQMAVVVVLGIIFYFFSAKYDFLEKLATISREHEKWEIDEFLSLSVFAVISLLIFVVIRLIEFIKSNDALKDKTIELENSLSEIKQLRGILPICASCKKIRDDKGYWNQIEFYIRTHSDVEFSHGICPECAKKLYPDLVGDRDNG